MLKRNVWKSLQQSILLLLVILLASQPVLVAAQPQAVNPRQQALDAFTASGDAYLSSAAEALSSSAGLVNSVSAIQTTPLTQLSENAIVQTRANALKAAESSAVALGSIDDLADSIESFGGTLPAAFDPFQRAGEGLPQDLRTDLMQETGLSADDVDAIANGMDDLLLARQDMAANGLPAELAAQLSQAGFSQTDIDGLAEVMGNRGLANTTLTTSLEQFRASQDEWADVRTQLLILHLQLLGYQIGVRQANGLEPRAVTEAELQEIAQDELRLLIHVAHLQELWGTDPHLNVGEGDWWFIEHYAGRAAERLDALIVESQNRALVADLFVLQEMKLLALTAKSGDAEYVKAELDGLGALLAQLVGDATFVAHQREEVTGIQYLVARLVSHPQVRERVQWQVEAEALVGVAKHARLRMEALGVESLAPLSGVIAELNEDNNSKSLVFLAGLSFLDQQMAGLLNEIWVLAQDIGQMELSELVLALLSGDTDNSLLVAANLFLGMIPVVSILTDLFALLVEDGSFMKGILLFALFCDLGEALALIPGLQIAAGAFIGGGVAAVVRVLFRNADVGFKGVLNALKLTEAFNVVVGLVKVVSGYITTAIHSLNDAVQVLQSLLTGGLKLWDNFVAFVKRVGIDLLLKLGFDEGSLLVGRILNFGVTLTDEALVALKNVSDDLVAAGVNLSDEAAEGLGKMAKSMEPDEFKRIMNTLGNTCSVGSVKHAPKHARLSASGVCDPDLLKRILTSVKQFDDATLAAAEKLAQKLKPEDVAALLSKYAGNPDDLAHVKSVFSGLEKAISNPKYGTQAVALAKSASDADIPYLGKYFDEISSIDLALVNVEQGFKTSQIAQEEGFNIYVAGRLADTPEEKLFRENASLEAEYILSLYKDGNTPLPQWARQFDNEAIFAANNITRDEFLEFVAKYETSEHYRITKGLTIEWYQVKTSTGELEVDAFIEGIGQNEVQIQTFKELLAPTFDVPKADIYNEKAYLPWMEDRHTSIPWENVPAGSIKFGSDGSILHELLP